MELRKRYVTFGYISANSHTYIPQNIDKRLGFLIQQDISVWATIRMSRERQSIKSVAQSLRQYLKKRGLTEQNSLFRIIYCNYFDVRRAMGSLSKIMHMLNLKSLDGLKVLDVGCGTGLLSGLLSSRNAIVIGIDIVAEYAQACKTLNKDTSAEFIVASADALPLKNGNFDLVVCNNLLEHLSYYQQDMCTKEVNRVLKTLGKFYITCENKLWPYDKDYQLWFIKFMPRGLANLYVRLRKRSWLSERSKGYDVYPLTYFQLLRKLRRNGLSTIIHSDSSVSRTIYFLYFSDKVPRQLRSFIKWFSPKLIAVGCKS